MSQDKRRRDPAIPGKRSTFLWSPPAETAEAIERLIRDCDMSANAVITRLVEAALPRMRYKNRTVKEITFED